MRTPCTGTQDVMPPLGESVTEATISRWLKTPCDTLDHDEPLLEVATNVPFPTQVSYSRSWWGRMVSEHAERVMATDEVIFRLGHLGLLEHLLVPCERHGLVGGAGRPAWTSSTAFCIARVTRKMTVVG